MEFVNLEPSHASLQRYMDNNYPHLGYKIAPFKGKLCIPMKGLKK